MSTRTKTPENALVGHNIVQRRLEARGYSVLHLDRELSILSVPTLLESKFQRTAQAGITRILNELLGKTGSYCDEGWWAGTINTKPRLRIAPIWGWLKKTAKNNP